jgi:uncharacterized protein YhjY with autotransporter beta-barrel domain
MSRKRLQGLNGNISSFRGGGLIFFFILATLAAIVPGPAGLRPAAANDAPVIDGNTATYSGNQQPDPITQNNTNIYTINVQNLTTNVGSSSTGTAISLTNTGTDGDKGGDPGGNSNALSLNYTGGNYNLLGSNYGVYVSTTGGSGKEGDEHSGTGHQQGLPGGVGGGGGTDINGVLTGVTISTNGAIQVAGTGVGAYSAGGSGGKGGEGHGDQHSTGGAGGAGGAGGTVSVTTNGAVTTSGLNPSGAPSYGIDARSAGGAGGMGGTGNGDAMSGDGGAGGQGGAGGNVTVTNYAAVNLTGDITSTCWFGINALSTGGNGGQGGTSEGGTQDGVGGVGGGGGAAGAVTVNCNAAVNTLEAAFIAVNAAGIGGNGGSGGTCNTEGTGGNGGSGGGTGPVSVNVAPGVTLNGGIWAVSSAGAGGAGGGSNGSGGDGGSGAPGGSVTVTCNGSINVGSGGPFIHGILAQSWGGAGGAGGTGKHAGSGGQSGAGGAVIVNLGGSIQTAGQSSYGILAQSLGGAGGNSGGTTRIITHSGDAGNGADGGAVTINTGSYAGGANSSIVTQGIGSTAICAQSVGGGGGTGDSTSGVIMSLGGSGGSGGQGGAATVNNGSLVITQGFGAHGIHAQSVGGGGGNAGGAVTGGIDLGFAIGGSGGTGGGGGGQVNVITTGNSIATAGDFAHGILAESIGGGGGNGGYAITGGTGFQVSMGGSGGSGGDGGKVYVGSKDPNTGVITYCTSPISTTGFDAKGILAQSIGGGGGAGGYSIAAGLGSAPIAIGGTGGGGGAGEEVNVYNAGAIRTSQDLSQGIFAQSVGGGGGNGGYSFAANVTPLLAASFSFGGKASPGGAGGAVTVQNTGTIQTGSTITHQNDITEIRGVRAHGILAQSVGGSGGHGGWAGSGSASFSLPDVPVSVSMSLSMGGSGGSGNDGGNVTVYNLAPDSGSSFISTLGDHAYGILAQSIGGGGGAGGGSAAAAMSFSGEGSFNMSCPIAIGGHGGTGGAAGTVTVTNQNAIQTSGYNSLGIMAQSIGGGGGDGGASLTGSLSGSAGAVNFSPQVTIGGDGGDGGDGNTVNVTNTGAITTTGVSAIGIEAQSIGGSGGNGNGAFSGNVLLGSSTGFNAQVTVGGTGGNGGAGGNVTVTNGDPQNALIGMIQTSGHLAPGILAQSIGGGGGNGGQSVSLNYSVKTGGAATESKTSVTINPSFNIGGNGGSGGDNSKALVKVENYANIYTAGARSYGIQAQCIGGGGGNGGGVFTLALGPDLSNPQNTDPPATNLSANVTVGGNGGAGGGGGQVQVDNYGAISTQGAYSYGIFAQSVGGGGGAGGSIDDLSIVEALSKILNHSPSNDFNHGADISVGGKGGAAGDGNAVTVNNYGAIGTSGDCAHGIFAQSVGGGGGDGGVPTLGLTVPDGKWSDWQSWLIPDDLSFEVGGAGGAAGAGNTVTVNNYGAITTSGIGAMGIYAQSVGGGGGVASYDQSNGSSGTGTNLLPGTFAIGGKGGSAGDGGEVSVTNSGVIQTGGRGACGIYAQSIGGGGGNASVMGGPWEGIKWLQYFGFGINIGAGGGDGGNGGTVTVTNTADITTRGDNANGIFAQSIGGQGGSGSVITQQPFLWNGSTAAGVAGTGGTVTISHTGNITTSGNDAHGIVAQSSAGKDTAGNVTVTFNNPPDTALSGNIITSGLGSCGIVAQSLGLGGNGQIEIDIYQHGPNTGLVQGGHSGTVTNSNGSTTTYNAYGVLIMDGQNNTLLNHGSISTLDGATGTAVMVQASYGSPSWGDLTINNYGTITGSVNQGTQAASAFNQDQNDPNNSLKLPGGHSSITFNNNPGSTYNAGPVINLGGGTLSNGGVLSLGTVQSTLTGNFNNYIQPGSSPVYGTFQTTVNGDGTIGQLNVSGTANLGGTLQVLKGSGPFKDGTSSSFLVANTATGNFTNLILPAGTSLVNFTVQYTGASSLNGGLAATAANAFQIVSHVKSHTTVAAGSTQTAVGGYLDRLLGANPTGSIARILAEIQGFQDASQFRTAFESLTPSIYGANTDTTFTITRQYHRTLQQRLESLRSLQGAAAAPQALSGSPFPLLAYNGSNAGLGRILGQGRDSSGGSADRLGVWLEGFGQWGSQGSVDNVSGYNYGLAGTGIGVDYLFTKNLILGANFGYSYSNLNMDNSIGKGRINSLYGSLYGTYFTDRAYVEGVLSYGNHQYANNRRVSIGSLQSSNQSSHTGNAFAVLAEGGYKFPVQQWNLTPFAAISFCNLSEGRIEESGALATMQVSSRSTNSLLSELGVRVDKSIQTSKGTLVPVLKASWQHDYGVSKNNIPFTLIGAPVGVTVATPRASQDRAVVRAGLTFKAKGGITSSIQYMGEVGEKTQNHGVIGQFRFSF